MNDKIFIDFTSKDSIRLYNDKKMKKYKILPFYKIEIEDFKKELENAILDFKGEI